MPDTLARLDESQRSALAAVCALYLSQTRHATAPDSDLPTETRAEILRRREVCALVTGGAE